MRVSSYHLYGALLIGLLWILPATAVAEQPKYSLNVYGAKLTSNNWEEFFLTPSDADIVDSQLYVLSLAKRLNTYRETINYEIEGQLAKHDGIQNHWELNGLGVARWEPFWWDRYLDTSAAFGLGLSFATEKPKAEIINEGDSEQWMVYWMLELAFSLPQKPELALISRIHHRSEAYGLVAEKGGSNALAVGLKYRF
jgi:hypothetical protein